MFSSSPACEWLASPRVLCCTADSQIYGRNGLCNNLRTAKIQNNQSGYHRCINTVRHVTLYESAVGCNFNPSLRGASQFFKQVNLNLFDDSIGQFAWDLRRLIVVWRAGCVDPSSMWRRGGGSGGAFCACVVLAACAESAGGGGASPCVV